jgi:Fe-S-cluster containining protein
VIRYPRPATLDEKATGSMAMGGESSSPCVFLGEGGCRFAFEDRPRMCQSLEPSADGGCDGGWDRRAAALAWLAHQDLVAEALARLRGEHHGARREPPDL